jgi:hypothetical protein
MHINNRIKYHKKGFWTGILLVQFFWFYLSSKVDFLVDFYGRFFEFQKPFHQSLFSFFPFSVGDGFYCLLGFILTYLIIKIIKKNTRNLHLKYLLILFNILYFAYQIFWGMLYFNEPLIKQFAKVENPQNEAERLALKYLNLCKQTRNLVTENKKGVFAINDLESIKNEIIKRQSQLPKFLGIGKSTGINSLKPSQFKRVMSYSGILGYYNPFTAEAQYNSQLPSAYTPFTLAHESMHQFGIAREQEANFTAYLIGRNSENASLRYSTEYFVLKSLLNSLIEKNPEFVKTILQNYSPAMKKDRNAEINFREKHKGIVEELFDITNDLFLKSNQQEGSITYSYFVDLLIRYENKEGL